MPKDIKMKTDCIGRPIPEWTDIPLFIPVNHGNLNIDGNEFLKKNKYTIALTSKSQSGGESLYIKCKLKKDSKILNMNSRSDYIKGNNLAGKFIPDEVDEDYMYYISLGGYAGLFYPSRPGVWLCDLARHLDFIGIEKD